MGVCESTSSERVLTEVDLNVSSTIPWSRVPGWHSSLFPGCDSCHQPLCTSALMPDMKAYTFKLRAKINSSFPKYLVWYFVTLTRQEMNAEKN